MIDLAAIVMASLGQVELRRAEPPPPGEIVRVDAAGVHLNDPGSGTSAIVGWDRVRAVHGEHASEAAAFLDLGEKAWRARARLERGDAVAAEPLFEDLFERYRTIEGPTTAFVCEGLLRCRLRRGSRVLALEPWLTWIATNAESTPSGDLSISIDPEIRLAPALPPIWIDSPAVRQLAMTELAPDASGQPARAIEAADLRRLYWTAARFETGLEATMPALSSDSSGVRFVADIVESRIGGVDARRESRRRLESRLLSPSAPWAEAWCRVALGRSYILEPGRDLKLRGVLHLLHAPARFERAHPYLAGVALADATATLGELGDSAGAERLMRELRERYPGHPALERGTPATSPGPGAPGSAEDHP